VLGADGAAELDGRLQDTLAQQWRSLAGTEDVDVQVALREVPEDHQSRIAGHRRGHAAHQPVEVLHRHRHIELQRHAQCTDRDGHVVADAIQQVALEAHRQHASLVRQQRRQLIGGVVMRGAVDHHERAGRGRRHRRTHVEELARDRQSFRHQQLHRVEVRQLPQLRQQRHGVDQ